MLRHTLLDNKARDNWLKDQKLSDNIAFVKGILNNLCFSSKEMNISYLNISKTTQENTTHSIGEHITFTFLYKSAGIISCIYLFHLAEEAQILDSYYKL